ncbi:MAG: glycosyltransferase family 2 protein [PVC group bacterium]
MIKFEEAVTNKKILVILPAYNEEGKIGTVVSKIKHSPNIRFPLNIAVVSDGSTDQTDQEARAEGALVLKHADNRGVGAAIRTGLSYARENGYDIVIVMAGDDQDDPNEIPDILEPIVCNGYDFVQGSRRLFQTQTVDIPLFRRITTKVYSLIFSLLVKRRITDGTNGFRAFKMSLLRDSRINLNQDWLNTYELEPYLYFKVLSLGYRVRECQVTKIYHKAVIGYSKMVPFLDWWRIIKPIFLLAFRIKR